MGEAIDRLALSRIKVKHHWRTSKKGNRYDVDEHYRNVAEMSIKELHSELEQLDNDYDTPYMQRSNRESQIRTELRKRQDEGQALITKHERERMKTDPKMRAEAKEIQTLADKAAARKSAAKKSAAEDKAKMRAEIQAALKRNVSNEEAMAEIQRIKEKYWNKQHHKG